MLIHLQKSVLVPPALLARSQDQVEDNLATKVSGEPQVLIKVVDQNVQVPTKYQTIYEFHQLSVVIQYQ